MEETAIVMDVRDVRETIGRHMLADGLNLVVDLDRSRGSRIFDSQSEREFLDFFGFFATNAIGFNHPLLATVDNLRELGRVALHKPTNSDAYTREMAEFVSAFSSVARPDFMKYMFFIEGGALAVENALKTAFDWKVRLNLAKGMSQEKGFKVLHFRQAFHGRSGYTLSLTNTADPRKTQFFPKFDWPRVSNPKCSFPLEGENLERVKQAETESIREILEALERHPDEIACIILEPIQAEGGDNYFRPEFHRRLREICDEHDMLLVHDEVQTGFGVTGRFWACEHYVQPDIIAFGKKSQVCGILAGERLDRVPDHVFRVPSRINSTWGGNLVDMTRCRMILEIYENERILETCIRLGEILHGELIRLQQEFPDKVSNVRGKGLLCAFDLPSAEVRDAFRRRLFEKRLIILGCGERSIRFRTALNIPEEDLREGVEIMREALAE